MPAVCLEKNLTIYYLDPAPQNPIPVLLLHGLGADGSSWNYQLPPLCAAGFRPIAPDARGFGKSTYPSSAHQISTLAEDLVSLLDHLNCETVHLIGLSLGGITGLQLAMDYPDRVMRLVLINAAARLFPYDLKTSLYYAIRLLMVMTVGIDRQAHLVAGRLFPKQEEAPLREMLVRQINAANPRAYRRTMLALARFDVTPRLKSLRVPTLVLTGAQDTTILPHRQTEMAARIPQARQVRLPDAGHAVTVQRPDAVNKLILEFLKNDSGPSGPN